VSYKKALTCALDRPGGRFLLGKIATRFVRRAGGDGIQVAHIGGMWTRRVGPHFFPDGLKFEYIYADFDRWKRQAEIYAADATDYWLQHYSPREGDVIVDVGAGRGEDTLTFSNAVGASGRVIAIEAHPLSFAILNSFCLLNRLANVTPLQLALMDKPGTVQIADSDSSWKVNAIGDGGGSPGVQVRAGTLDDLCDEHRIRDIAFVKMNIEGAERYALLGAQSVMPRIQQICVACHDFWSESGHGEQFRTRAFVERFLMDHGFTLASRPHDPRDYVRDHVFGLRNGNFKK